MNEVEKIAQRRIEALTKTEAYEHREVLRAQLEERGLSRVATAELHMLEELTAQTTDTAKARALYQTDWDEDGTVSIHVPREIAIKLLERRGWTTDYRLRWVAPDGTVFWNTDEALQIALAAEVL